MRCDNAQHLVELVADEDQAQTLLDQALQGREQRFDLARRQHRGRLVEDQDPRAGRPDASSGASEPPASQRLQDLDPLPLADRQAADQRIGVDLEAEAAAPYRAAAAAPSPRRENGCHSGSLPSITLSSTLEVVGQREMLVHHADAGVQRGARIAGRQRLAEDFDLPGIGAVVAEQDRHQRALAGAVFAEQRQHLAAPEIERDVVVGNQVAEALADATKAQRRRLGRQGGRQPYLPPPGLRLRVVDLDAELAVEDRLLARLHLGHQIGRHLAGEAAQRRQLAALVLHHRILAVVLGLELAGLDGLRSPGRSSAPCSTAPRRPPFRDICPGCR